MKINSKILKIQNLMILNDKNIKFNNLELATSAFDFD